MLLEISDVLLLLESRPVQLARANGPTQRLLVPSLELYGGALRLLARLVIELKILKFCNGFRPVLFVGRHVIVRCSMLVVAELVDVRQRRRQLLVEAWVVLRCRIVVHGAIVSTV